MMMLWLYCCLIHSKTNYRNFLRSSRTKCDPSIPGFILPLMPSVLTLWIVHMWNLENHHSPCRGISLCRGSHMLKPSMQLCHLSYELLYHPTRLNMYELKIMAPQPVGTNFHHLLEHPDIHLQHSRTLLQPTLSLSHITTSDF